MENANFVAQQYLEDGFNLCCLCFVSTTSVSTRYYSISIFRSLYPKHPCSTFGTRPIKWFIPHSKFTFRISATSKKSSSFFCNSLDQYPIASFIRTQNTHIYYSFFFYIFGIFTFRIS